MILEAKITLRIDNRPGGYGYSFHVSVGDTNIQFFKSNFLWDDPQEARFAGERALAKFLSNILSE